MRVQNLMTTQRPHTATRAIVLYEGDAGAVASVHPIRKEEDRWVVGSGRPLTRDALAGTLRQITGQPQRREILGEHILYSDSSRLLWYRPAKRRPIFFHTGKADFDADLRGKHATYPALLFLAVPQNLYVWALRDDRRPGEATRLLQAPFLNIYDSGHLCSGTTKLPLQVTADVAPWERAFFETTFTHSNLRDKLTSHPGGHDGLWRALAAEKAQPDWEAWLRPLKRTVGDVLNQEVPR